MRKASWLRRADAGFTLVEILIVVVILGILASVVATQVVGASQSTREAVLRENLRMVRTQLIVYKQLHTNPAGIDGSGNVVDGSTFKSQLIRFTNMDGDHSILGDSRHPIRPCLSAFPANPMTESDDVLVMDGPSITCNGSSAWIYNVNTQEFVANSTEYGPGGKNW